MIATDGSYRTGVVAALGTECERPALAVRLWVAVVLFGVAALCARTAAAQTVVAAPALWQDESAITRPVAQGLPVALTPPHVAFGGQSAIGPLPHVAAGTTWGQNTGQQTAGTGTSWDGGSAASFERSGVVPAGGWGVQPAVIQQTQSLTPAQPVAPLPPSIFEPSSTQPLAPAPSSVGSWSSSRFGQPVAPAPVPHVFNSPAVLGQSPVVATRPQANYWMAEVVPSEILFGSYLGDPKGARMASRILHDTDNGWIWELEAGGRAALFRYGTPSGTVGPYGRPEGFQIDVEGAAFPRLNFEQELDLDFVDYRVGVPFTYQRGPWQYKLEPYHLSSHVGDELLIRNPAFQRVNYLRDALRASVGYYATPDVRVYGEAEYAFNTGGGAEPWHFQFGFDYSPAAPTLDVRMPQPFFAANVGLREEVDFGGGVNLLAGLQWRGRSSGKLFRLGVQYYNGKSFQYEIFDEHEELLGVSIWYDF